MLVLLMLALTVLALLVQPPGGHSIENALVYDTAVVFKTAFVNESNFVYDNAFVVEEPCDTTPLSGQVDCSSQFEVEGVVAGTYRMS
jgi:hypothetical protein